MKPHNISKKSTLVPNQIEQIFNIWNHVYPTNVHYNSIEDFEIYLNRMGAPVHYLSLNDRNNIIGWLVAFDRDNERWFAMIVDDTAQGKGIGSSLLNEAKNDHSKLSGWVVDHENYTKSDGSNYPSPLDFYLKIGFKLQKERFPNDSLEAVKVCYIKPENE